MLSPRNEDRKFLNLTFFFLFCFAPTLSQNSYVSDWNFPKIGNEFK